MASILLVTSDPTIVSYVSQLLSGDGHQIASAEDGAQAVAMSLRMGIDLIVADSVLSGLKDVRELIGSSVPYIFLAAGASLLPGRLPLRDGDHVVVKPLAGDDLRSAVAAALQPSQPLEQEIDLGGVTLDRSQQRLMSSGGTVQLTPIEFQLLDYLARAKGAIATTEDLLQNVWHHAPGTGSSDVIRSHLKNLRSKLREITASPDLIETVPRRGYRLATR